ncbi:hypothetical protein AHF37_12593 [Paragonimus kellicotti]|nr:hypothetical protein AHF37_12593 [Paragonimus kellicotti]
MQRKLMKQSYSDFSYLDRTYRSESKLFNFQYRKVFCQIVHQRINSG